MAAAIKQVVTVGEGGRIEIPTSQLPPGTRAEVSVTVQESSPAAGTNPQLEALRALQASMQLDRAAAEEWIEEIRAERAASRRPPG